ncbi:MAG: transposase [Richelia sp. RM2_1_2]|nr:transposase [Richelia sp. SM2_1_7]NJM18188.1 transposase [Richelia sp. SM1_7_0]NJN08484.1 transposase [Richelia sp. RM1_1_1]NJO29310.1 transposase [Richelia sp. SL_2_1]NJO61560.1 transposase [Richelia sp. RM2_1_2]NJS16655.1 transposase [Nostocaceae cyanobacterium CSU_2_110]
MRKLTESDKKEILKLYRESAETTSTLAERYGVSNSTISRLLKSTLPEDEYEYLVSLKRAARTPEGRAQVSYDDIPSFNNTEVQSEEKQISQPKVAETFIKLQQDEEEDEPVEEVVIKKQPILKKVNKTTEAPRRVKRRSSAPSSPEVFPVAEQLELLQENQTEVSKFPSRPQLKNIPSPLLDNELTEAKVIAEMFGEELDDTDDLEDLDDLLEDDDDFDDEDDDDDDDFEEATRFVPRRRLNEPLVRVLPLTEAHLPRTCYLVIDRAAELITRPLRDFSDLGEIPSPETQETTLPIFDNHRVAKRFSSKRDRVIKVPDSKVLHKARYQLQAKGITRLLIDGQVYSLSTV